MHTDFTSPSVAHRNDEKIKYNFPCFSCFFVVFFLLRFQFLLVQFTITLKYDYILLTQLNIICISLVFSVFLRSCLNTFIMIIHIALQEVLLYFLLVRLFQERPAKMFSEKKNSPLMMPLFSVVCLLSLFSAFIAHLIIPHILKTTKAERAETSKFTGILSFAFYCSVQQQFVNCIGHFDGNRLKAK